MIFIDQFRSCKIVNWICREIKNYQFNFFIIEWPKFRLNKYEMKTRYYKNTNSYSKQKRKKNCCGFKRDSKELNKQINKRNKSHSFTVPNMFVIRCTIIEYIWLNMMHWIYIILFIISVFFSFISHDKRLPCNRKKGKGAKMR